MAPEGRGWELSCTMSDVRVPWTKKEKREEKKSQSLEEQLACLPKNLGFVTHTYELHLGRV